MQYPVCSLHCPVCSGYVYNVQCTIVQFVQCTLFNWLQLLVCSVQFNMGCNTMSAVCSGYSVQCGVKREEGKCIGKFSATFLQARHLLRNRVASSVGNYFLSPDKQINIWRKMLKSIFSGKHKCGSCKYLKLSSTSWFMLMWLE